MSVRSAGSSAPAAGGGQGDLSRMRWRARLEEPAVAVVALLLAWIALVAVANPTGSFPLNDDWSYSRAVKNLVEHGELEFTGWTSMTLVFQVMWGALFCLPFGFSFLALRLATAALGALGVVATYLLLREFRVHPGAALMGASVVALTLSTSPCLSRS